MVVAAASLWHEGAAATVSSSARPRPGVSGGTRKIVGEPGRQVDVDHLEVPRRHRHAREGGEGVDAEPVRDAARDRGVGLDDVDRAPLDELAELRHADVLLAADDVSSRRLPLIVAGS
jgi:hypothetical protein